MPKVKKPRNEDQEREKPGLGIKKLRLKSQATTMQKPRNQNLRTKIPRQKDQRTSRFPVNKVSIKEQRRSFMHTEQQWQIFV